MGDSGSLVLGLLMAASTIVIGGRAPEVSGTTYFFFAPLFLPLFILGVPIADMAFAFVRRTARGQSFHTPDKDHLHHRLLRLGHGHRRSVIILWLWTALLSAVVLFPLFTKSGSSFIPLVAAGFGLFLYTIFHPRLKDTEGHRDTEGGQGGQGAPEAVVEVSTAVSGTPSSAPAHTPSTSTASVPSDISVPTESTTSVAPTGDHTLSTLARVLPPSGGGSSRASGK